MSDDFRNAPGSNPGERTGPHPVVVATRNEGTLVINTKTIIVVLVALLGGTVSGGGITLANTQKGDVVEKVNESLNEIKISLTEMKAEVKAASDGDKKRDEVDADHEVRIRKLESTRGR